MFFCHPPVNFFNGIYPSFSCLHSPLVSIRHWGNVQFVLTNRAKACAPSSLRLRSGCSQTPNGSRPSDGGSKVVSIPHRWW